MSEIWDLKRRELLVFKLRTNTLSRSEADELENIYLQMIRYSYENNYPLDQITAAQLSNAVSLYKDEHFNPLNPKSWYWSVIDLLAGTKHV